MKKNIKSIFKKSLLMLCVLLLCVSCFSACNDNETGKNSGDGVPADFKTFETIEDTDYSITYYWGPDADHFAQDDITLMKEAGFDTIPIQRFPSDYVKIRNVVKLLDAQGLNAAVCDDRITGLYEAKEEPTQETVDAKVQEVLDYYAECKNVTEWIVCDEPSAYNFDRIAKIADAIHRLSPEDKVFVNLLPSYAKPAMLGTDTYKEYVESFCEKVNPDYICFDYYDLLGEDYTETHRGGFVANLATVTDIAKKYNKEARVIVLLTKHGDYANVTDAEIRWQSNLSILFGLKSLSFFSYAMPADSSVAGENAMTDGEGKPTEHYVSVQNANNTTRAYGDALYNTSVDKVFSIDNTYTSEFINGVEKYTSYGALGEVKEGIDMMVSFYNDGSFMIMNGNSDDGNPRKLITKDLTENLQWLNPYTRRWETFHSCFFIEQNSDGTYEIVLAEGNAVLLRVGK